MRLAYHDHPGSGLGVGTGAGDGAGGGDGAGVGAGLGDGAGDGAGAGHGPPVVVLHREASADTGAAVTLARAAGATGRVVVPYGPYAFYPSGMEVGGICWYRVLPGYDGTDPVSLATAVVQVADLLDDLELERALVVGFGQGAVVAVGAGLLRPDRVGWVAAVDPWPGHLPFLPPAVAPAAVIATAPATAPAAVPAAAPAAAPPAAPATAPAAPPVLLAASSPGSAGAVDTAAAALAGRGMEAATWCPDAGADGATEGAALAGALGRWWAATGGPAAPVPTPRAPAGRPAEAPEGAAP